MAIDTQAKRQSIMAIAMPWIRYTLPDATKGAEWRASVGNVYNGNAITPAAVVQVFGGGGKNARGNIPRKTARGAVKLRGGLSSLTAPKRPRGGIF